MNGIEAFVNGLTGQHWLLIGVAFVVGWYGCYKRWALPILPQQPPSPSASPTLAPPAVPPPSPSAAVHAAPPEPATHPAVSVLQAGIDAGVPGDVLPAVAKLATSPKS